MRLSSDATTRLCIFTQIRLAPGFGTNLLSGPRMESAGWVLSQRAHVFTALHKRGKSFSRQRRLPMGFTFCNVQAVPWPVARNFLSLGVTKPAAGNISQHEKPGMERGFDISCGQDQEGLPGARPSESSSEGSNLESERMMETPFLKPSESGLMFDQSSLLLIYLLLLAWVWSTLVGWTVTLGRAFPSRFLTCRRLPRWCHSIRRFSRR